jgi:hypothetical protein
MEKIPKAVEMVGACVNAYRGILDAAQKPLSAGTIT